MVWYLLIAGAVVFAHLFITYGAIRNFHYVWVKMARKKRTRYRPATTLIVPCKGIDTRFLSNVQSFMEQEYENYTLFFVVEAESDPAYAELCRLRDRPASQSHAREIRVLVAGRSRSSSQKIHNLLHAVSQVPPESEVLAFADSDISVPHDWLDHLVQPLYQPERGATTGYRWLVPTTPNPATLAASALNGVVAQCLGNTPYNEAWGGSMAIRVADFHRLGIPEIWSRTLSDDLSLSRAVKQAGLKVAFVPQCLVASFEFFTWRRLFEFGRRQFLITRIYAPYMWWPGLVGSLGSVVGLWGSLAVAAYAAAVHAEHVALYAAVPVVLFAGQILRAVLRQITMAVTLRQHLTRLAPAAAADIFGCWLWSIVLLVLMLSSAVGRTIRWRGIRYRLVSPTDIQILEDRRVSGSLWQRMNPAKTDLL